MKVKWKPLLISLLIPLGVGGLSALLTQREMEHFEQLRQPPLSPPSWLFPIVWTVLFLLMGIACYLVWTGTSAPEERKRALVPYGLQLAVNFCWTILFFNFGLYYAAFAWLLLLWGLIVTTMLRFYEHSVTAGRLMFPYLLWVTFAGYLNLAIAILN